MFRFAPSPNGWLHLGHALSALLNFDAARRHGGRFLLRIEDIDLTRARRAFEVAIFDDLAWLGLDWERPVLRQSERLDAYRAALDALDRLGLLYPAFLTRGEIRARVAEAEEAGRPWPRDPDGAPLYPGPERDWSVSRRRAEMAGGRDFALRLDMARAAEGSTPLAWTEIDPFGAPVPVAHEADPAAWGDVVLARKETPASYHLSVTVDDAFQGIGWVARGLDLQPATGVHRLLQHLLGLPEPAYFHHRLVLDEAGRKLSKSEGAAALRARRAAGDGPEDIRRLVGLG
ncbi:MAG TPA: tRNA glutamyl-Q(34) synthetase GluQRS [Afifellaceae bacterium]|nr:tRNA glutamyl-Q(34) synthetase GluQRS [Afifellaceae bacterium]